MPLKLGLSPIKSLPGLEVMSYLEPHPPSAELILLPAQGASVQRSISSEHSTPGAGAATLQRG